MKQGIFTVITDNGEVITVAGEKGSGVVSLKVNDTTLELSPEAVAFIVHYGDRMQQFATKEQECSCVACQLARAISDEDDDTTDVPERPN